MKGRVIEYNHHLSVERRTVKNEENGETVNNSQRALMMKSCTSAKKQGNLHQCSGAR